MKSPAEIARSLARQWLQSNIRLERLLNGASWPQSFNIGKPSARTFAENVQAVQRHVETWRKVQVGEVEWVNTTYRAGLAPVSLPLVWRLHNPSEWISAANDPDVSREYAMLEHLVERTDKVFHRLLIVHRSLWLTRALDEVITTAELATRLSPGCAQGRPLRLLAEHGVDTKFFERNASLLTRFLDERFDGVTSEQGLTTFLDAYEDSSHWVLVVPLAAGILPFKRLRLTTAELADADLPGSRLLVVENEQCIHQLPPLPDTLAVLGAGLDLHWLKSPRLTDKQLAYWGDMDTWGLLMLARARQYQPGIKALLMEQTLFERYSPISAVAEPSKAQDWAPAGLLPDEADFYRYLLAQQRGRLEQEYLPRTEVEQSIVEWISLISDTTAYAKASGRNSSKPPLFLIF